MSEVLEVERVVLSSSPAAARISTTSRIVRKPCSPCSRRSSRLLSSLSEFILQLLAAHVASRLASCRVQPALTRQFCNKSWSSARSERQRVTASRLPQETAAAMFCLYAREHPSAVSAMTVLANEAVRNTAWKLCRIFASFIFAGGFYSQIEGGYTAGKEKGIDDSSSKQNTRVDLRIRGHKASLNRG